MSQPTTVRVRIADAVRIARAVGFAQGVLTGCSWLLETHPEGANAVQACREAKKRLDTILVPQPVPLPEAAGTVNGEAKP